ncbi:MAG: hypothetical protein IPJ55_17000 [Chloracidobacterium sp.]|nr:hypothetical protein [Chloracidobacterium sp.]
MNDREFAAAHDRYLDPPDFDDTEEEDEDSAYDKARERRQAEEDQAADNAFWRDQDEQ